MITNGTKKFFANCLISSLLEKFLYIKYKFKKIKKIPQIRDLDVDIVNILEVIKQDSQSFFKKLYNEISKKNNEVQELAPKLHLI